MYNRVIDRRIAEEFAKNVGMEYIETSAKQSTNVDQAFDKMLQVVVKAQNYLDNNKKPTTIVVPDITGSRLKSDQNNSCCWK